MKPLSLDIPFPDTSHLSKDIRSANIISFAYASLHSELTAILQYNYHAIHWANFDKEYAETMMCISLAEMIHIEKLGETMLTLGVDPVYKQSPAYPELWYNTSCVARSKTPQKMLIDDIQGELNAITDYKKMVAILTNETVSALIQRIIMDEQLHVETLTKLLKKYKHDLCNTTNDH